MTPQDLDRILPPGGALGMRLFARLAGVPREDPPLPAGTLVGDWRVGELLGRGGSSTVYLAERADGQFEQKAALKIVHTDHGLMEHFRRERQILAELRHPAIAQLIDGGQLQGGRLWFAMEPVFGERIDHYVRGRKLPLADRLALFDAVCEAVAYAHSRLLIHRDIKPGNLLVDELGKPRLLDFGIATSSEVTERVAAMTPIYASPEQRSGGAITTASDVYQLGLLLRALTLPDGEPCATLPAPMRPVVRRELAAIVACATELEPSHRYPTVAALRADVAAVRQRRPVSVVGGMRYPAARFLERHAAASAIAAAAVIALLSTGWIAAHRVQAERDQARAAAVRARATSDFLIGLFSVSDPGENRGERLTANQILARGATQLGSESKKDPAQMAAVAQEIGRVYMELGEFKRARDVLTNALEIAESTLPGGAAERVQLLTLRGRASYFLSDYEAAAHDFAAARGELAHVGDPQQHDADDGILGTQEAQLLRRTGKIDDALAEQTRAIDLLARTRPPDDPQLGLAWNNMGVIQRDRHDYPASAAAYRRAYEIWRDHYGEDHPRVRGPLGNLAEVLVREGKNAEAEPLLVENIARYRVLQDGPSLPMLSDMTTLTRIRLEAGRLKEAAELAEETSDGFVKLVGPDHNYRAFVLVHLGNARLELGDGPGALDAFQEALRIRRLAFGEEHPDVANSWTNLASAYARLGDASSAEGAWSESVRIFEHVLPPGHVTLPRTRLSYARTLLDLGRIAAARAQLARAGVEFGLAPDETPDDLEQLATLNAEAARAGGS